MTTVLENKMYSQFIQILKATLIILLWPDIRTQSLSYDSICPIGFQPLQRIDDGPLCFRPKGPETFADKYKDCVGNLYSSKLYHEVKNLNLEQVVWTEYKSMHPGGIYVDWSYSKNMGEKLNSEYAVTMDPTLDLEEELCLVMDPYSNYTAVKCNEMYFSICVVKPYSSVDLSSSKCNDLKDAVRFYSPESTCLSLLSGVGGGTVRATWTQAQELCLKKGGSLLNRGWRYVNHKKFRTSGVNHIYPFGITMSSDYSVLRYDTTDDKSEIPFEQWNFRDDIHGEDTLLGSIQNNTWDLVNSSFIFYDVICEKPVPLKNITMHLTIDVENKLTLTVNESMDEEDIYCFTDSINRYPVKTSISKIDDKHFILKPKQNGYYWCTHIKIKKYKVCETKKILFIREKKSVVNTYAVKIKHNELYKLNDIATLLPIWKLKLRDYITYWNQYERVIGDVPFNVTEDILKEFINSNPKIDRKNPEIVEIKLKRLYMDRRSLLVHTKLRPYVNPVSPATWEHMEIVFMKPVYYCKSFDTIPQLHLGESIISAGCRAHTCVGDFNEGVQWITTASSNCTQPLNRMFNKADDFDDAMPTISYEPEEKLREVMEELDQLINNGSTIMVEDINPMFDQVDDILDVPDSLEIPGQFLHLLEKLGSAIELNGSRSAFVVRSNIALGMSDAGPGNPVRGLKIGTRETDLFTNGTFEMLFGEPNKTELMADINELVVNLPKSVLDSSQRLSFVVFRNDRAFQSSEGLFAVNSRILSVKVGNVTQFDNGEVIDIHLSPLSPDPERNISRTCAYWEFLEDGSGFWSQEGCRLIISEPGKLDICRCTHLTHFAEVLFPRSVFSKANEDALEMLTIIGCALSIFGVIIVGVTSAMFRSWRREFSNKIWFQLCISIFILAISFLVIIFAKFDHYSVFCMLFGIILHYSVLSSFCWMLVAAVLSYRRLVLVFTRDASHKLLRASAFSWGAPFAVIGVLLSIAPHSYSGRFVDKTPSGSFCYPSDLALWLSIYLPIALILLVNWTLFGLIVRSVFASSRIQRHGDTNEAFRCASVSCLLVFLFGLPWVFGLFAFNIVAAYLFTLTATYQGFILFLFFVVGNKKTRDLWLNKLKIKQTRKVPVTSSTYSNRSTVWRGATPNVTLEAKASKPKSLNQDDSRFS